MTAPPPLTGIRVLEFAGLAPGPYAGLLLADYGATVLRIDRSSAPTADQLTRRKSSITVNLKSPAGIALIKALIPHVDVLIDPFRPGVLEKLGLDPDHVLLKLNPRLVVGRMTGFRRDGKYSMMAGHDINYIAVSGVLSLLGRAHEKPYAPGNILGDFAGGGAVCFMGIVMALFARERNGGKGQVVEANMVDGSASLASMPRLGLKTPFWGNPRGTNTLDGGCPYYDTYETMDGQYMAVGALEPQFFAALLKGLHISSSSLPGERTDPETWPFLRRLFTGTFLTKTRAEWERIFDGTDACCTPILTNEELEKAGYQQRPIVTLKETPGLAIHRGAENGDPATGQGKGVESDGWSSAGLTPGDGGDQVLGQWMGWRNGEHFLHVKDGLELTDSKAKL